MYRGIAVAINPQIEAPRAHSIDQRITQVLGYDVMLGTWLGTWLGAWLGKW